MRKVKPTNHRSMMSTMDKEDIYPSFSLPLDAIPEAKKWDIGKHYKITLEVEMTRLSQGGVGMMESSSGGTVGFDVYGVEAGEMISKRGKVERYQDPEEK